MAYPYQNPNLSTEERVEDLMARMTTKEKISQLNSALVMNAESVDPQKFHLEHGMGEMVIMNGTPQALAESIARIQKHMITHTRLQIPVLFHNEALSGLSQPGAQLFPTSISLGATFSPEIVEDMCRRTRKQMRAIGIRQALSPVVDVARDLRWGRVSETYGGDPTLCARMGTAFVKGLQGEDLKDGVAATLKHFLGYSCSQGGLNQTRICTDKNELREVFAKPFEAAIRKADAKSVMNCYCEYDGKPVCASKEILTDLLRDDLGFQGVTVSDYMSVNRLITVFHTAGNAKEAGEQCLEAGLDVELPSVFGYNEEIADDADAGVFDINYINQSVRRMLTLKFELGLFDDPYPQTEKLEQIMDNTENNQKSRQAAMKVMTLTKNNGILPITDKKKKIAVIGPMGDAIRAHYSCYTIAGMVEMGMTTETGMAGIKDDSAVSDLVIDRENSPLVRKTLSLHISDQQLRKMYPDALSTYEALKQEFTAITYTRGCDYNDRNDTDFEAAKQAAIEADLVVMTIGGRSGWGRYNNSGEGIDSSTITLPGSQEELVQQVYQVNPNMVVVHTDARPLVSEWIYDHVPAILEGWLSETYGGIAVAKTLVGANNPGGRMPIDVPRSSAHGPIGHYFHNGTGHDSWSRRAVNPEGYVDLNNQPLCPFGFGMSYTEFQYDECDIKQETELEVVASIRITNCGNRTGDDTIQLYGADKVASKIRPEQELAGFHRITLKSGESKKVTFSVHLNQFSYCNDAGEWIIEKGSFEIWFAKNSRERIYSKSIDVQNNYVVKKEEREFFADVIAE